ncbi:MAG TPA: YcxB family protein [Rhizomicrobium sp.]|jgi:hypothetical protein
MSLDTINVQLTPEDYLMANRLHSRWVKQVAIFLVGAVVICAIPYFNNGIVYFDSDVLLPVAIYIGFVTLVFAGSRYFYLPRRTRRLYWQQKSMQRPFAMSWDEGFVSLQSEEYSARSPWSDYSKWREGEQIFMLYLSDIMFRIVPKRAFQDANEIPEFRDLLRRKISPVEGKKRV